MQKYDFVDHAVRLANFCSPVRMVGEALLLCQIIQYEGKTHPASKIYSRYPHYPTPVFPLSSLPSKKAVLLTEQAYLAVLFIFR